MSKKIIAYFLLLPIWVMLFHAVIPHHHHLDNILNHNSLEVHHQHTNNPCDTSKHCHAFNETVFFTKQIKTDSYTNYQIIATILISLEFLISEQTTKITYSTPPDIVLNPQEFHTANRFRGPPTA